MPGQAFLGMLGWVVLVLGAGLVAYWAGVLLPGPLHRRVVPVLARRADPRWYPVLGLVWGVTVLAAGSATAQASRGAYFFSAVSLLVFLIGLRAVESVEPRARQTTRRSRPRLGQV
ncbi:MAG: hypothetical protein ACYCYA_02760, partial [Actinomycetes bacterium]